MAVLWGQPSQKDKEALGCPVLSFAEVADKGRQNLTGFEANPAKILGSDLATLVYTSGTTGNPKVAPACIDCPPVALQTCDISESYYMFTHLSKGMRHTSLHHIAV